MDGPTAGGRTNTPSHSLEMRERICKVRCGRPLGTEGSNRHNALRSKKKGEKKIRGQKSGQTTRDGRED